MNLSQVEHFIVSESIIATTEEQLREAGQNGAERFVLWSVHKDTTTFEVNTVHIPIQTAYKLSAELSQASGRSALHALNQWLYEHEETLAIQVHAHPTEAYHSDTDDSYRS